MPLQAKNTSRLLILRPPRPPPPGVSQHDLLRAKGSIYGTKDAGRSWWIKLFKEAVKEGWISSKIEPAMFFLYNDSKDLTGIMVTHVDDLFVAGEGKKYVQSMKKLTVELISRRTKEASDSVGRTSSKVMTTAFRWTRRTPLRLWGIRSSPTTEA